MNETLTLAKLVSLSAITNAVIRSARVGWLLENGDVATGTLRAIGDQNGNRLPDSVDVRDGYVRITTSGGWETFPPLAWVVSQYERGEFVLDYQD